MPTIDKLLVILDQILDKVIRYAAGENVSFSNFIKTAFTEAFLEERIVCKVFTFLSLSGPLRVPKELGLYFLADTMY